MFNHSSPWPSILLQDPADINFFTYECEVGVPRVIVSEKPEIQVQDFGDHVNLIPFKMEGIEQFNDLAFNAIIKAHEVGGKTFQRLDECDYYMCETINCENINNVLISIEDVSEGYFSYIKSFLGPNVHIFSFSQIKKGEAYLLPYPEYLGVISEKRVSPEEEWYAIGIMNSRAVVKRQSM